MQTRRVMPPITPTNLSPDKRSQSSLCVAQGLFIYRIGPCGSTAELIHLPYKSMRQRLFN